jgi:hypothetical protein
MNANEEMLIEMDYKSNMSRQERQRRAYEEAERDKDINKHTVRA